MLVVLSALLLASMLTFYLARGIAGRNDRLFLALKIGGGVVALGCVIAAILVF